MQVVFLQFYFFIISFLFFHIFGCGIFYGVVFVSSVLSIFFTIFLSFSECKSRVSCIPSVCFPSVLFHIFLCDIFTVSRRSLLYICIIFLSLSMHRSHVGRISSVPSLSFCPLIPIYYGAQHPSFPFRDVD